jgi:hypothetical protein
MLHRLILWDDGKPTPLHRAQWVKRGGLQQLRAEVVYLEPDRSAKREFRSLWVKAFPGRPLPFGALANEDGKATDDYLDALP